LTLPVPRGSRHWKARRKRHRYGYPPTEQADNIIVSPVYPPQYQDFILVFPANSRDQTALYCPGA
jgi:hypothetical protein